MKRELDRAFEDLRALLLEHGGTIEKYIGDAIFALFGAPVAHADDAERAVRAASACAQWASLDGRGLLAIRIGIETGEAIVDLDALDARQRMAVGEVVNVAARLQAAADPGEILVGPTCRRITADVAEYASPRPVELKGIGAMMVATLRGLAAEPHQAGSAFVGRETELRTLGDAYRRATAGRTTFALVTGPPGQGKSRLTQELLRTLDEHARVLIARCHAGIEDALRPLQQLLAADLGTATIEGLRDRAEALFPDPDDRASVVEAIAHSCGLLTSERLLALRMVERRDAIEDAWRRYIASVARSGPLVIVVEDLHWAQPQVVRILDQVTARAAAPVLVVATARPEILGTAALRPSAELVHVELQPLDPDDAAALASEVGHLAGRALDRAAGNPLLILELARARGLDEELPITVQSVIGARIDELEPSDRQLLQRVSIVGESFTVRDAALLGDVTPGDTVGALARLVHGRYLRVSDGAYRFDHALVREVAYARLPVAERMRLHARFASQGIDRDDLDRLARHWWEALRPPDQEWVWQGDPQLREMRREAIEVHIAAAAQQADRLLHESAIELYTRASAFASDARDAARLEEGLGWAFVRGAQGDAAWEHRLRALDLYRSLGEDPPATLYADTLSVAVSSFGYFFTLPSEQRVRDLLEEGEAVARRSGDNVSLLRLMANRAMFLGDSALADEALRLADAVASPHDVAEVLRIIGQAYIEAGNADGAEPVYERVDALVAGGATANVTEILSFKPLLSYARADLARLEDDTKAVDLFARTSNAHTKGHALGAWALLLSARGEWERLRETANETKELVEADPGAAFCLIPATTIALATVADLLAGKQYTDDVDRLIERMTPAQPTVWAALLALPRVMSGRPAFGPDLERAYATKGTWHRDIWDPLGVKPVIARVIAERWDELPPALSRLDALAANGATLAAALAAAVREEIAAASGGAVPRHAELRGLGLVGLSELLRFRPA